MARPISLEAPNTSPVAYLKCFLAIMATKYPPINAPMIPRIPTRLSRKKPIMQVITIEMINKGMFIAFMKYCPVPLENGMEKVAHDKRLIFAAISEIKSTQNIKIAGIALIDVNVIIAIIKNREIPPVPIMESLIISIFFLLSP